ncbi:MAG: hypothetical protein LQ342_004152 [Letrouitia transgressa]|nr:MAG: hypothetical protein LQ342_004152 [Letrouitia transgressa]
MAPQRNLTLTEELEKLEQSITLTLQEIDHNFSRAHRIVTTSILPLVEQYAEHSKNVWEGSKFWKQFFEASANVSLSGYEEPPEQDETATEDTTTPTTTPSTSAYASPPSQEEQDGEDDLTITPQAKYDRGTPSHTTPKAKSKTPTIATYSSPYESLRHQVQGTVAPSDSSALPSTPRNPLPPSHHSDNNNNNNNNNDDDDNISPFAAPSTIAPATQRGGRTPKDDILLHRVLDKNWRLQATPHTQTRAPPPLSAIRGGGGNLPYRSGRPTPSAAAKDGSDASALRRGQRSRSMEELDSSPMVPAPELHAEIFGSPAQRRRIPGVSVLTPAKGKTPKMQTKERDEEDVGGGAGEWEERGMIRKGRDVWDSDEDSEEGFAGMSPPKTIQFHVPQTRLLRTPAREASKRIVEDLLLTAGGSVTDDIKNEDDSPSVVKRGVLAEDDTF